MALIPDTLPLYEPIQQLKSFGDDLWIVDGPVVRMALYGTGVPFTTRMTVVKLANGDLWLHSPVQYSPALAASLDSLGRVRHLVSPNYIHYAHIAEWKRAFPDAIAWASPGVRDRAAQQGVDVSFDDDLTAEAPAAWAGDIDQHIFRGSKVMEEVVFFHRGSQTLVLADLIENFEPERLPGPFRWLLKLTGVLHPDGKLPLDLRMTYWKGKQAARESFAVIRAWAPQRIVLSHGRCYPENALAELDRAFRWLK